jgi:hypothetical protein
MLAIKEVELSIVVPVKGQPGRCVGTLVRRVHPDMSLPEIIKGVRKELGTETEGCIYLDPENYRQSVHDWNIRHTLKAKEGKAIEAPVEALDPSGQGYTCQD